MVARSQRAFVRTGRPRQVQQATANGCPISSEWSDHVALVGGYGLRAGKENLTSYRRMNARWSKAPSQKAFTIGLTPQTERCMADHRRCRSVPESDALFCERSRRVVYGAAFIATSMEMDPTSDAFQASKTRHARRCSRVSSRTATASGSASMCVISRSTSMPPAGEEILLIDPNTLSCRRPSACTRRAIQAGSTRASGSVASGTARQGRTRMAQRTRASSRVT